MELCAENGLEVVSNTQVNRKNVHTMMPTARLLNDIGVKGMRIIRTTEAPHWEENAANACLSLEEYYQSMLDFAVDYSRSGMMMEVETWQYIGLIPKQQSYYLKPVKFASSERMGEGYCCNCTHSMVAVTSDGEIMPCNQMSGYFLKNGISMGTVRRTPLRDLLGGGTYVRAANMTVHDLGNSACGTCRHFGYCGGGCRALGLLYSGGRELAGLTCCPPGLPDPRTTARIPPRRDRPAAGPRAGVGREEDGRCGGRVVWESCVGTVIGGRRVLLAIGL